MQINKENITITICTHACVSHRLKLTVIWKSEEARCFKNVNMNNILVNCLHHKNAWLGIENFIKWFNGVFAPAIKKRTAENKISSPVLLLLDKATVHLSADSLPIFYRNI